MFVPFSSLIGSSYWLIYAWPVDVFGDEGAGIIVFSDDIVSVVDVFCDYSIDIFLNAAAEVVVFIDCFAFAMTLVRRFS